MRGAVLGKILAWVCKEYAFDGHWMLWWGGLGVVIDVNT